MILLVPDINILNFLLFSFLSLFYEVKTLRISSFLRKGLGRIKIIKLEEFFEVEQCLIIRSEAVKIWEDILVNFKNDPWDVYLKSQKVSLATKAKQEIQKEIDRILFFENIANFYKGKNRIFFVNSLKFNFLTDLSTGKDALNYPSIRYLSNINIFLDILNYNVYNIYLLNKVIFQYIYCLICKLNRINRFSLNIKYIYDGVAPRELLNDKQKITFSWLIDEQKIKKNDILFILPKADFQIKSYLEEDTFDSELITASHFNMNKFASGKILASNLLFTLILTVKNLFFIRFSLTGLMKKRFTLQILKWLPLVESLKPKVYLTSCSVFGNEDPGIAYFKTVGMETLMWSYSVSYVYVTKNQNFDFRSMTFSNILCSKLVVWNEHHKKYVRSHPQDGLEVIDLGPLMSGDEEVTNLKYEALFSKIGIKAFRNNSKRLVIFDCPPVSRDFKVNQTDCPDINTEESNYSFIRDAYKLLSDFDDLIMIFKPKRNLISGKFGYSENFRELLEDMSKDPRVIILDYNINPWIPIALADICIASPFESPVIAALHYEKPALFYDPKNAALRHLYRDFPELIVNNYEELKQRVEKYIYNTDYINDFFKKQKMQILQGEAPRVNSSNKFREYLVSLTN